MGQKIKIAVLASGSGSNADAIWSYFKDHRFIDVACVITNNANAGVITRSKSWGTACVILPKGKERNSTLLSKLKEYQIDYVVLAGYLKLIPKAAVEQWSDRILNIHPGLLPDFGGNGMYGMRVHEAVIASGAQESGLTIHVVNEIYDDGRVLFEKRVPVLPEYSAEDLARAVLKEEHHYFPQVIEQYIQERES